MKTIFKTICGLLFIYLFAFSCSKDNSPSVSVAPGNIQSQVDSANINFAITSVKRHTSLYKDTVSIIMTGYSSDSAEEITISFMKVVGFTPKKYTCGTDLYSGTSVFVDYYAKGMHFGCDGIFGKGSITVISYNSDAITGKFELSAGKLYDTSKIVNLTGQFNAVFDINTLIKDIDVPLGKMKAKINDNPETFSVLAAVVSFNGVDSTLVVTGTSGTESIVLQFTNLYPTSGQVITINREPFTYSYIKGSYTLDTLTTFVTNGLDSASFARFTIVKIARTYVQGKFEFIGRKTTSPNNLVNITEGKFNSIIDTTYMK